MGLQNWAAQLSFLKKKKKCFGTGLEPWIWNTFFYVNSNMEMTYEEFISGKLISPHSHSRIYPGSSGQWEAESPSEQTWYHKLVDLHIWIPLLNSLQVLQCFNKKVILKTNKLDSDFQLWTPAPRPPHNLPHYFENSLWYPPAEVQSQLRKRWIIFYTNSPKMPLNVSKLSLNIIKFLTNIYGGVFL